MRRFVTGFVAGLVTSLVLAAVLGEMLRITGAVPADETYRNIHSVAGFTVEAVSSLVGGWVMGRIGARTRGDLLYMLVLYFVPTALVCAENWLRGDTGPTAMFLPLLVGSAFTGIGGLIAVALRRSADSPAGTANEAGAWAGSGDTAE